MHFCRKILSTRLTHFSDNAETVQVVLAFVNNVSSENLALALTRGRADVVNLFGLSEDERSIEDAKKMPNAAIVNKTVLPCSGEKSLSPYTLEK